MNKKDIRTLVTQEDENFYNSIKNKYEKSLKALASIEEI